MMTNEEYAKAQSMLAMLANVIADVPLEAMLERINHSETLAPIVDPTLWSRGSEKLELVKRLVQAALPFKREAVTQIKAEEEGSRGVRG